MGTRKMYNTTLDIDLLREIKILAAQIDMRQNDVIEEAIRDLIEKYKHQELSVSNGWVTHRGRALENFTFIGIMILGLVFFVLLILAMKDKLSED